MTKRLCAKCGSDRIRAINCGFNATFLLLWLATGALFVAGAVALAGLFLLLAGAKTVLAFFQWKRVCRTCKSGEILPADSPVGRKLLAELHSA